MTKRASLPAAMEVTACIPTIAPRKKMLERAVKSVWDQTQWPRSLVVVDDRDRHGPALVRNDLMKSCDTKYVAFLDDDDRWLPNHLELLYAAAKETDADLIYPWFHIEGPKGENWDSRDPLKIHDEWAFGREFDDLARAWLLTRANFIPVTVLVKREALLDVGGFPKPGTEEWEMEDCEDWGAWQRLARAGATFNHVPEKTWVYSWHPGSTRGRTTGW